MTSSFWINKNSTLSAVNTLLVKNAAIYIPNPEINFIDIDEIFKHSSFFIRVLEGLGGFVDADINQR